MKQFKLSVFAMLAGILVAGCSSNEEEIQQWIAEQQKMARPKVEPITAPKDFVPQAYEGSGSVEPFSSKKLVAVASLPSEKSNALLLAERSRQREQLESFPLDTIGMVGSVRRNGTQYALLRAEGLLYYVTVGNYIGQNFGRITAVTETGLTLREMVQDATGDWVERMVSVQLQESGQ